jgi:hypothetical protein
VELLGRLCIDGNEGKLNWDIFSEAVPPADSKMSTSNSG